MIRGLYTASLGMTTQMNKMDVVSNNIANANTTGYKKDNVITQTFTEEFAKRLNDSNTPLTTKAPRIGTLTLGLAVDDIYIDFSNGSMKKTEGPLDIALDGSGFFVINSQDGNGNTVERYSRDGSFTLSSDGLLVTCNGDTVMGQDGAIEIPNGEIVIDDTGRIYSNNTYVDTLKIVDFEDKTTLRKYGSNLYDATGDSKQTTFGGQVVQGFLENSNINSVKEMVDMVSLSRAYEANQRVITTHDTLLNRSVNDLGKR